ncbi:MAG: NIPSNAP family protein, partial [Hyphomicrobiaceae bacterium]
IYSIDSLGAYEQYRLRLAADPLARENFEFAEYERFITREDRTFLKLASISSTARTCTTLSTRSASASRERLNSSAMMTVKIMPNRAWNTA